MKRKNMTLGIIKLTWIDIVKFTHDQNSIVKIYNSIIMLFPIYMTFQF